MKSFRNMSAIVLMALVSATSVMAQSSLPGFDGYDSRDRGGWLKLSFSDVAPDGSYTVNTAEQIAVSFKDLGMPEYLIEKTVDARDKTTPVWLYRIPDGSTLHPIQIGAFWRDLPTDVTQIPLDKVRVNGQVVVGQIKNGASSFKLVKKPDRDSIAFSFVVKMPKGQAWGSLTGQTSEDSPFTVVTVDNRPAVAWKITDNKVGPPTRDQVLAFKHQK